MEQSMKAFYLARIQQVETTSGMGTVNTHRIALLSPGVEFKGGAIRTDPTSGAPIHAYTLCVVDDIDHTRYRSDPDILPLPNTELSVKLGSIGTEEKIAVRQGLLAFGVPAADVEVQMGNNESFRSLLTYLGRSNDDVFSVDAFSLY